MDTKKSGRKNRGSRKSNDMDVVSDRSRRRERSDRKSSHRHRHGDDDGSGLQLSPLPFKRRSHESSATDDNMKLRRSSLESMKSGLSQRSMRSGLSDKPDRKLRRGSSERDVISNKPDRKLLRRGSSERNLKTTDDDRDAYKSLSKSLHIDHYQRKSSLDSTKGGKSSRKLQTSMDKLNEEDGDSVDGSDLEKEKMTTRPRERRPGTHREKFRRGSDSKLYSSSASHDPKPKRHSLDEALLTGSFTHQKSSHLSSKERHDRRVKLKSGRATSRRGGSMDSFTVPKGLSIDIKDDLLNYDGGEEDKALDNIDEDEGDKKQQSSSHHHSRRKGSSKVSRSKSTRNSFSEGGGDDNDKEDMSDADKEVAKKVFGEPKAKTAVSFAAIPARKELKRHSSDDESSDDLYHKTEAGEPTSELDAHFSKNAPSTRGEPVIDTTTTKSSKSGKSSKRSLSASSGKGKGANTILESINRRKWQCFCCMTCFCCVLVALVVAFAVISAYNNESEKVRSSVVITETNAPSEYPSFVPTQVTDIPSQTPSLSPVADVSITIIVQLDEKPEETGFSLTTADNSTTYFSRPIGSLAGMQSEVLTEVVFIPERTELLFTLDDEADDGICCSFGNGFYRVVAGTGDTKTTMVSGERAGAYTFTVGKLVDTLQVGGVDPNEYCKPCPEGKDCGRCAWCDADRGFLPDTIFSYYCHEESMTIPKKCFIGDKRIQLHNSYVALEANCVSGFKAWPQLKEDTIETTVCVEEVTCIKKFIYDEPNCDQELPGSILVKETCMDKIGGSPFGYDWGLDAPRQEECPATGKFAASLAQRCCTDGVAYCSTFFGSYSKEGDKVSLIIIPTQSSSVSNAEASPTSTPTTVSTYPPTMSFKPTYNGHPITILIQLDDFPEETGFSITNTDGDIIFIERQQGFYKTAGELVVEKVQIPEGVKVVLTLTDREGDGTCCGNGFGSVQVYSSKGSILLDEDGSFTTTLSKAFIIGEPNTQVPTKSISPTISPAPTVDLYSVTIEVQLDQWSRETGFSIKSIDGSSTFHDWPTGAFADRTSDLIVETVQLPNDIEAIVVATDTKGDGFCCLYGDGYVKIYAGESADDESALIIYEPAIFESILSIPFLVGDAISQAPGAVTASSQATSSPAAYSSAAPTSSIKPTFDAVLVTVVIQLDKFSSETSWSINSSDGVTFASRPVGYYEDMSSRKVVETVPLTPGLEYHFSIFDFMGDGINGWYALYESADIQDNSTQLFIVVGDEIGRIKTHTFVLGEPRTLEPTTSSSIASEAPPSEVASDMPSLAPSNPPKSAVTATTSIEVTIKFDGNAEETGWSITAEDGTVIVDRKPGHYTGKDSLTGTETILLAPGNYTFTVLDSYGDGFCCDKGVGFYSVYSNSGLLLFREGRFEYLYTETFSIGDVSTDESLSQVGSVAMAKSSSPMLRGSSEVHYKYKRQRKHAKKSLESEE